MRHTSGAVPGSIRCSTSGTLANFVCSTSEVRGAASAFRVFASAT